MFKLSLETFTDKGRGAKNCSKGGSPGLVVMGGDSCPEGRRFESQHCILDECSLVEKGI